MEEMTNVVEQAVEETVNQVTDTLQEAAGNVDVAAAAEKLESAVIPVTSVPAKNGLGKELLKDGAIALGGVAVGVTIDRWVVPAVQKGISKFGEWRKKRKAEKAAKKAAKAAAKSGEAAGKGGTGEAVKAAVPDEGIDPMEIQAEIE